MLLHSYLVLELYLQEFHIIHLLIQILPIV
nr:MAG TPA: hypothetical protein [Caudoviricetes sp.]